MTDLERFVLRLIEQVRSRDPGAVHRPLPIGELRERVLPYRLHRGALGLSSNDDYETLVLRLVAEEDGLARTVPAEAADLARTELGSPNPDLDVVEQLGEATVQIGAAVVARLDELGHSAAPPARPVAPVAPSPAPEPTIDVVELAEPDPAPEEPPLVIEASPSASLPPDLPVFDAVDVPEARADADFAEPSAIPLAIEPAARAEAPCPLCAGELPAHRPVNFCPHCGGQVGARRCGRCGDLIEAGWRHCVGCGLAVPGPVA